jgi:predicted transcriptional regulator
MKEIRINQFDDQDYQNVEMLRSLGINRNMAHVIVYMANQKESRGKEIEIATGLRQPQVSHAMKKIRALSWIDEKYSKKVKGSKGRPYKIYNLNISIYNILDYYQNKLYEQYQISSNVIYNLKINLAKE